MGVNPPKSRKREFFSKIRLEHFFSIIKIQLCAKNHQNLMRGFLDIASRTHERTNARTHERESFSSHRRCRETKNQQNSMKRLEDVRSNVDFGPKRVKFGPKRAGPGFFPDNFLKEDHKPSFYTKN